MDYSRHDGDQGDSGNGKPRNKRRFDRKEFQKKWRSDNMGRIRPRRMDELEDEDDFFPELDDEDILEEEDDVFDGYEDGFDFEDDEDK
jgi:hypothetical protein